VLLATPATAPSCTHHHDSVVVIGSGMSGLAAAKVLSQHFSSVRVLERDTIPQEWTGQAAIDVYKVNALFGHVSLWEHMLHMLHCLTEVVCMFIRLH
jgi:cation diffusion facilitator CzcD-associated flavoprotein CzcO